MNELNTVGRGILLQIPEEVIQKIKEQNDIVDIISENVKTKKNQEEIILDYVHFIMKNPFFYCISGKADI